MTITVAAGGATRKRNRTVARPLSDVLSSSVSGNVSVRDLPRLRPLSESRSPTSAPLNDPVTPQCPLAFFAQWNLTATVVAVSVTLRTEGTLRDFLDFGFDARGAAVRASGTPKSFDEASTEPATFVAVTTARSGFLTAVPVTSTKSLTGHLLGGAGALGAIATLQALRTGDLPGTYNVDNLDPEVGLNVITGTLSGSTATAGIVNAFGFGGHSVALVVAAS